MKEVLHTIKTQSLADWVLSQSLIGHYVFTLESIEKALPDMSLQNRRVSLSRLVKKGTIMSPWRGFYITVPTEYKLKGEVPPIFWMDALMKHLERDYYVSLLSAAEFYGAAHQRPMTFSVMVQGPALRSGVKNGTELVFMRKESLSMEFVRKFPTQMGTLNVSSPELTSLDLVACQEAVGGLNRVSTVLSELVEQMDWEHTGAGIFAHYSAPTVQRLGYILENVLEESKQAEALMNKVKEVGINMCRVPLKLGPECKDGAANNRWNVIVNMEIEIDEIWYRDLYDLYVALTKGGVDDEVVVECYKQYMGFVVEHLPTWKEFMLNMDEKMQNPEFLGDVSQLLRAGDEVKPVAIPPLT